MLGFIHHPCQRHAYSKRSPEHLRGRAKLSLDGPAQTDPCGSSGPPQGPRWVESRLLPTILSRMSFAISRASSLSEFAVTAWTCGLASSPRWTSAQPALDLTKKSGS